jgi:orotidine-5'-phosphate decarboxylase
VTVNVTAMAATGTAANAMKPRQAVNPRKGEFMVETASFGVRVAEAVGRLGPLCAGIDPSAALLESWGLTDDAAGLRAFSEICVDALAGAVAVIKPQVAFFERHGSAGLAVLEQLLAVARGAGLLVLADAKRGDIDTTAAAYAEAWLGQGSRLRADAVTVHPYLGLAALAPFVEVAARTGRGVIVVTRSSNPEGRQLQEAATRTGDSVEDSILAGIAAWNGSAGIPTGTVGAVVGATLEPSAFPLSQLGGVILAPGLGAQGAQPADLAVRFAGCAPGSVLASTSRALLATGPKPSDLRRAAIVLNDELAAVLG